VQRELYEKQGEEQLRTMLTARPRGSFEVIAAETRFEFTIERQKVVGRMDRLDRIAENVVRVVDYKTGAPKDSRFADESLQLSIYAMGARQMGFVPRELVLLNLQGNEEVVSDRSPADLEKAKHQISEVAEGIAKGKFDPTPGRHCRWCDYSRLCPETEQRVFIPAKTLTPDEDKKAAGTNL
jgi:RecB family exonuclease